MPHRWTDLFDLVMDLKAYPDFVPHCRGVRVFSRTLDHSGNAVIVSRMTVGFPPVEVGYTNRTVGDQQGRRITVESVDGPLEFLNVVWNFEPEGEDGTVIEFSADYEFSSRVLAAMASRMFEIMFGEIVDAFETRADRVLGPTGMSAR